MSKPNAVKMSVAVLLFAASTQAADAPPGPITVTTLQSEMLSTATGKRLSLLQLDVAPGASAAPHQHEGYLFVYVVSGAVRSQITGDSAPVGYKAGESFVEKPGMQHLHFENASATEPARLVISWFADDGATQTRPLQ